MKKSDEEFYSVIKKIRRNKKIKAVFWRADTSTQEAENKKRERREFKFQAQKAKNRNFLSGWKEDEY